MNTESATETHPHKHTPSKIMSGHLNPTTHPRRPEE